MAEVNPADQDAHNAEIARVKDQITQAKADLGAEDTRIAAERAALDAQAYRIMLDKSASNEVLKRRHRSRLPPVYDARNLFNTPGAGTSNPPVETERRHLEQGHWFSHVWWIRLVRTTLWYLMSPHHRVIILTQWTTLSLPLHGWRPS